MMRAMLKLTISNKTKLNLSVFCFSFVTAVVGWVVETTTGTLGDDGAIASTIAVDDDDDEVDDDALDVDESLAYPSSMTTAPPVLECVSDVSSLLLRTIIISDEAAAAAVVETLLDTSLAIIDISIIALKVIRILFSIFTNWRWWRSRGNRWWYLLIFVFVEKIV